MQNYEQNMFQILKALWWEHANLSIWPVTDMPDSRAQTLMWVSGPRLVRVQFYIGNSWWLAFHSVDVFSKAIFSQANFFPLCLSALGTCDTSGLLSPIPLYFWGYEKKKKERHLLVFHLLSFISHKSYLILCAFCHNSGEEPIITTLMSSITEQRGGISKLKHWHFHQLCLTAITQNVLR